MKIIVCHPSATVSSPSLFWETLDSPGVVDDYPGHSGYIPTETAFSTIPWTSFPKATYVPPIINLTQILPFAPGTRLDCVLYMNGADQYVDTTQGNQCENITSGWGVSSDQLSNWNPSLNASDPNCHFDPAYRYCVQQVFTPQAPAIGPPKSTLPMRAGTWTNCTAYEDLTYGETCQQVLDGYYITLTQLYAWNPAIGSKCENLWIGYQYCVRINSSGASPTQSSPANPTPSAPVQSGQPANCNRWYIAVTGDTCASVEQAGVLSDALFKQLNPAVKSDCSGLWATYAYCIGTTNANPAPSPTSTATTTSTSPTSSPTGGSAIPSPTQVNSIAAKCNKYAQAASGSSCSAFAATNGVSTTNLYAWNSVLGGLGQNCNTQFWSGYYYCTGVSA